MGSSYSCSSTWIVSLKALLISIGVVYVAIFLKLSVSLLMEIATHQVPLIWSLLLSCLKPPYLYLLINAIILTIVASSHFHNSNHPRIQFDPPRPVDHLPMDFAPAEFGVLYSPAPVFDGNEAQFVDVKPVLVNGLEVDRALEDDDDDDDHEIKLVVTSSTWNPPQRINSPEFVLPSSEKPLVSTRFGHRKPLKASPEEGGNIRGLRVAKQPETLESTWKRIKDGSHVPLTRHLRKSDTWENHGRHVDVREYARSVTLRDRSNYEPPPAVRSSPGSGEELRKEVSLSRDELNRRVEAFINKFNEDMRLQRQESLNQYKEMIARGGGH